MAFFQGKMVGNGRETEKIKIIVPIRFYPTLNREFKKNSKKTKENQKTPLCPLFKPRQVGEGREREKMKIIVPIRSYTTRNRKFKKNSINIQKIKKYLYGFLSSPNRFENAEKERK